MVTMSRTPADVCLATASPLDPLNDPVAIPAIADGRAGRQARQVLPGWVKRNSMKAHKIAQKCTIGAHTIC
jgi:hypothetical protein